MFVPFRGQTIFTHLLGASKIKKKVLYHRHPNAVFDPVILNLGPVNLEIGTGQHFIRVAHSLCKIRWCSY